MNARKNLRGDYWRSLRNRSVVAPGSRRTSAKAGAALIQKTREQMGSLHASAPARAESVAYYPKMGFARHESAWILRADESLTISRR